VLKAGGRISYLSSAGRWTSAKITSVTDQSNLVLAIVNLNGSRTALNGGVAVPKKTSTVGTNVWTV
jgi:hypothetical protein